MQEGRYSHSLLCRSSLWRIARRSVPRRTGRNVPIAVACPVPVRFSDDVTLGLDEGGNRTFTILILRTSMNASQWNDAIVDDYADLWISVGLAGEHFRHIIRPAVREMGE